MKDEQEMSRARLIKTSKWVMTIDHGECYDREGCSEMRALGKTDTELGALNE